MSRKRHAFTLVELLVVVGIIAVLISILLPSLARARQAAINVQCQSNLKQVGQAFLLYQNEFKGFLPSQNVFPKSGDPVMDQYRNWGIQIMPYLITPSQQAANTVGNFFDNTGLRCPAKSDDLELQVNGMSWSYGMNGNLSDGDWRSKWTTPARYPGVTTKSAADVGVVMDHQQRVFYTYDGATKGMKYYFTQRQLPDVRTAYRHPNKSLNLLYLDGHVENRTFGDLFPGQKDDGTQIAPADLNTAFQVVYALFDIP